MTFSLTSDRPFLTVLDRPFLTAFDVPANVAAAVRIDRSGCLGARHAVSPLPARECRALKGMTRTQIALVLSTLDTVGIGVILSMGKVTVYGGRSYF